MALRIGGMVVRARGRDLAAPFHVEPHYGPFLSPDPPDLDLVYRMGECRERPEETLFESGGVWTLHRLRDGSLRFDLRSEVLGSEPYAQARVAADLRSGEVLLRSLDGHLLDGGILPFVYPLDEVLAMMLLSRERGLLVHAAAVADGGHGLMFPGVSGAGKSTLARAWRRDGRSTVLTDDRTIVGFEEGSPVIHGTPWHGEAELSSPDTAGLDGLFFLEQAPESEAIPLAPSDAAAELVARSFPTWWDPDGVAWALEAAARIVDAAPAYRLRFTPDRRALETVREVIGAG